MARIIPILFLALAVSVQAAPFHRKPAAKPVAPAVTFPLPEPAPLSEPETPPYTVNPDGSVLRSRQADAELKDWIVGLQTENRLNGERADKAEMSERVTRGALAEAVARINTLQDDVNKVTADRNAQAAAKDAALTARDEAFAERDKEHVARVASDKHVSTIKNYLSLALGLILVLAVSHIPSPLIPYPPLGKVGAMVAAMGLGWVIVARFV